MEADRRGFKGVWLCAAIYESQELSPVEKLLLAEIDALTTDANACYAGNSHFATRLGITVTRADHLLGKLTRLGYIVRVSFDGRVIRRVLAPEYSSNPGHSIAFMMNAQRQIRSVKNNRAALSETTEQDCDNRQGGTVKNSRATYIKKIPDENTSLETTTTCNSDSNNQNGSGGEATEASSSRRFLDGDKSSGPQSDPAAKNPAAALVDQLVREYGLSKKQRQTVEEYSTSLGLEYVRRKVEVVKSQPRRNAAGALLAALHDDWQPSIQFKTDAVDGATRLEASRELAKRMGWEW
jgi:hypothetical protein